MPGWLINKQTPKVPTWARSRHGAAHVTHRIRYVLEAVAANPSHGEHRPQVQRGLVARNVPHYVMAVWVCGTKCTDWRGFDLMSDPTKGRRPLRERCHGCENPRL